MKKLFTLLLSLASFFSYGQWDSSYITFDPGSTFYHFLVNIDTINYHHNIWEIGKPNKTVFTSAYSAPNAIITDTLSPYLVNDTSVFTLKMPGIFPFGGSLSQLSFYYQLDIDSGVTAKVEVSEDSGNHWTNVIDSLPEFYSWPWTDTPNLKMTTTGWAVFELYRNWAFPISDSVLFRFTFISDSLHSGKDGWMIDNISTVYFHEGIPQIINDNLISICPNPSKGNLYIHAIHQPTEEPSVSVYDIKGEEVYKTDKLPSTGYLSLPLPDGVYTLKYATKDEYCVKRIVIAK